MAILTGMSGGPEACSFGSFSYLNFAVPNAPLAAWWMAANASFLMAVVARCVLPALVATAGIGYFGRTDSAKAVVVPFSICMAGTWWLFSARGRPNLLGTAFWVGCPIRQRNGAGYGSSIVYFRSSDLAMELRSQSGCALELCVELCGLVRRQGFLSTSPGRYWILSAAILLCQVDRRKTRAVSSERAQPSGATAPLGTET